MVALAAGLVLTTSASSRPSGGGERAFVAAEHDGVVVALDLERGGASVLTRLRVAERPRTVAVGARSVLIVSPAANRVTLVEPYEPRVLARLGGFRRPVDAAYHPLARYAYVTEAAGRRVAVIDVSRRRVVTRVRLPDRPRAIAVSRGGARVWITGDRSVTVLHTRRPARPSIVRSLAYIRGARDAAFACGDRRVWLTFARSWEAHAFTPSGRPVVWRRLDTRVDRVHADHAGNVWVTGSGTVARLLEGCTGRVLRTLRVGRAPRGVAVGMFRGHVAVASRSTGTLTVLDPASGHVARPRIGHGLDGVGIAGVP